MLRRALYAAMAAALIHCVAIAQQVPVAHHCDSAELQDKSCTNPGNCFNACAFWCTSAQSCASCCAAFPMGSPARQDCRAECDAIPWI